MVEITFICMVCTMGNTALKEATDWF